MIEIIYTTTFHGARRRMGLTNDEFCLCDLIFKLQSNPRAKRPGWCSATRGEMAEFIGITRRGCQKMIDRMVDRHLLELCDATRDIRATAAWYDNVVADVELLPRPMKIGPRPSESRPPVDEIDGEHENDDVNFVHTADGEQSSRGDVNNVHADGEQSSRGDVNNVHADGEQSSRGDVNNVHADGEQSSQQYKRVKEPRKKREKKSEKVAAEKQPPVIHRMVDVFETQHKLHFKDETGQWVGFQWSDKEFGGLKELRKKLSKRFTEKFNRDPGDDEIVDSFSLFLQRAVSADEFYLKLFTPSGLNGQFQNAINRIYGIGTKNGSNGNHISTANGINGNAYFSGYGIPNP